MRLRAGSTLLPLLLVAACATMEPSVKEPVTRNPRIANLQRAAGLPWRDEGLCVVYEASHPWPVVVERCFHALDLKKIQFRDTEQRCQVASADAATLETMVGICLLAQPELAVGAVIIIGTVVVAVAIAEELDDYARRHRGNLGAEASSGRTAPGTKATSEEPQGDRQPEPDGSPSGRDSLPPWSPAPSDRDPECTPRRVPPKGGHTFHNTCADNVPLNAFRGANALVNGKAFDALQPAARMLWEVKTDNFDTYPPDLRDIVIRKQVRDFRRERELARACGFGFRVGVRSAAHKAALEAQDATLDIVVMGWC